MKWLVPVALALIPLLTWIPLTIMDPALRIAITPYWFLACLALLGVAWVIGQHDPILGLIVGYMALRAVPAEYPGYVEQIVSVPPEARGAIKVIIPTPLGAIPGGSLEVTIMFALGACLLLAVQSIPSAYTRRALLVVAGSQLVYLALQWMGIDPIWARGEHRAMRRLGTLGQENYVGAVLGMIGPLAPLWLLPGFLAGFRLAANNLTGAFSLAAGLARRWGLSWGIIGVAGFVGLVLVGAFPPPTLRLRQIVWRSALSDYTWWSWLIGHGWGAWPYRGSLSHPPIGERFLTAHNEWVQGYYEGGLLFLVLIGWWLWAHREAWVGMWGGGVLAVGVSTLGFFTFHAAIPAMVAIAIVGGALRAATEGGPSTTFSFRDAYDSVRAKWLSLRHR